VEGYVKLQHPLHVHARIRKKYAEYAPSLFFTCKIRKICLFFLKTRNLRTGLPAAGRSNLKFLNTMNAQNMQNMHYMQFFCRSALLRVWSTGTTLSSSASNSEHVWLQPCIQVSYVGIWPSIARGSAVVCTACDHITSLWKIPSGIRRGIQCLWPDGHLSCAVPVSAFLCRITKCTHLETQHSSFW
jgi:hypothetical protein